MWFFLNESSPKKILKPCPRVFWGGWSLWLELWLHSSTTKHGGLWFTWEDPGGFLHQKMGDLGKGRACHDEMPFCLWKMHGFTSFTSVIKVAKDLSPFSRWLRRPLLARPSVKPTSKGRRCGAFFFFTSLFPSFVHLLTGHHEAMPRGHPLDFRVSLCWYLLDHGSNALWLWRWMSMVSVWQRRLHLQIGNASISVFHVEAGHTQRGDQWPMTWGHNCKYNPNEIDEAGVTVTSDPWPMVVQSTGPKILMGNGNIIHVFGEIELWIREACCRIWEDWCQLSLCEPFFLDGICSLIYSWKAYKGIHFNSSPATESISGEAEPMSAHRNHSFTFLICQDSFRRLQIGGIGGLPGIPGMTGFPGIPGIGGDDAGGGTGGIGGLFSGREASAFIDWIFKLPRKLLQKWSSWLHCSNFLSFKGRTWYCEWFSTTW